MSFYVPPGVVESADSVNGFGATTAPGAGGDVVAAFTPGVGTWLIQISLGASAGTPGAADVGNMKLMKNAATVCVLANPINRIAPMPPVRLTLLATDTIGIKAVVVATAGVVYEALLTATKLA
jgi:hypothetical protein